MPRETLFINLLLLRNRLKNNKKDRKKQKFLRKSNIPSDMFTALRTDIKENITNAASNMCDF
jgi:hypothetical protein